MRSILFWLVLTSATLAHNGHQTASVDPNDQEMNRWIQGLKNASGIGCCAFADGFPALVEWDAKDNSYRVRNPENGQWYVVLPHALLTEPNRLGYAMVWWYVEEGDFKIRCFLPGALF